MQKNSKVLPRLSPHKEVQQESLLKCGLNIGTSFCVHYRKRKCLKEHHLFQKNSMYVIYSETGHQPRWDA